MNALVVVAHHDDLELGCGGTVAKLVDQGHHVTSVVMTHSGYRDQNEAVVRSASSAQAEGERAAKLLGYDLICLAEDTHGITVTDQGICKILSVLSEKNIDTVFTHWHNDTHPPHRRVNEMVLHACRRVPRVFGFAVNWYLGAEQFEPRVFVSLSESHWNQKISALLCYETELARTEGRWQSYLDRETRNNGIQIGAFRAEAFLPYKFLWDLGL
jgi:LmbE family N-acetylglucosaminyl deacetylase